MSIMADLYPGIEMMRDVFEAGLTNPNPTLHCLGVLLNAGRIEYSHGEFYYYEEGMTPGVCRAIEAIDQERLNIGKALRLELLSLKDTYPVMKYGPKGDTFWQVIRGVLPLIGVKGPAELDNRYLTEDVPIGLVCFSQLGRQLGVDTKLMESVIYISNAVLGRDLYSNSRTLAERAPHYRQDLRRREDVSKAMELLAGIRQPETARDHLELAYGRYRQKRFARATEHFARLLEDTALRLDRRQGHLYRAACSAALAASSAEGGERKELLGRALLWIQEDVSFRRQILRQIRALPEGWQLLLAGARQVLTDHLDHVRRRDPDLAALRELPEFQDLLAEDE